MTLKILRLIFLFILSTKLIGQNRHFKLGYKDNGISFGNSKNFNGLRLNVRDKNVNHLNGISISGLLEAKSTNGLAIGLVAASDSTSNGIKIGVLASSSYKQNGIAISGILLNATHFNGIGVSMITMGDTLNGVFIGLYAVAHLNVDDSIKVINGIALGGLGVRAFKMNGVSIAVFQNSFKIQNGVSIGIYNKTNELHGFQFGLINYAGNNRRIFRWTPFFNFNLKRRPAGNSV